MTAASKRDGLIVCCAVSAGAHAALVPEHLREHLPAGIGFVAATATLVQTFSWTYSSVTLQALRAASVAFF